MWQTQKKRPDGDKTYIESIYVIILDISEANDFQELNAYCS